MQSDQPKPKPYDGPKCSKCQGFIPCYSIEWSKLTDAKKCKCKSPGYPEPPIVSLVDFLVDLWRKRA